MAICVPPALARSLVGLVSGIVLLSALAGAGVAASSGGWTMFGFEAVVIVAGVLGLLIASGRFADGPGLALACVAGTIALGSVLGYFGVQRRIGAVDLTPFLLGRAAAAVALGLAAAIVVLIRNPGRSWPTLIKGLIAGAPVLIAAALAGTAPGRRLLAPVQGLGELATIALGVLAFLVLGALLAASVHLVIRAFQYGRLEEGEPA